MEDPVRFTISNKLIVGFLFVTLMFGITFGVFYYYMNKVNNSYSHLIHVRFTILNNVKEIEVLATQQTNSLRGYLLTENEEFEAELQDANTNLNLLINETSALVTQVESKEVVDELRLLNKEFTRKYEELFSIVEETSDQDEAMSFFKSEVLPIGIKFAPLTKYLTDRNQQLMDEASTNNTVLVDQINKITLGISVIVFIINLLIGFLLSRKITGNLTTITNVITSLTSESNTRNDIRLLEVKSKDEIGDIATAFNKMTKTLQEKSWLETSLTEVATMYQGIHDLDTLAELFISKITPMVGASYGIFYIRKGNTFQPIAGYAHQGPEVFDISFCEGEGIVGQAGKEKRMIEVTDVANDYKISSGIGQTPPKTIIVVPAEFEGKVTAIIELASFKPFSNAEKALLKQAANHIGITVNSVSGRMKIEHLLKESKALTEELQSQSEELQLQHEELLSMNEKLGEQYKTSEQKTKDLNKTKLELEEKAKQLELNSTYKSEFLANMSHELRSPLNSLLILAHLLAENEQRNLTDQQLTFVETIYKSGNDLLHLINEILDLSKIESGKIDISLENVKIKDLAHYAKQQFEQVAKQKGLIFSVKLDRSLPEKIKTDSQRLQQVIHNLLSNAMKFTEKGEVTLHIFNSPYKQSDEHKTLAFKIKDTGIGIPPNKQNLIFQAFQQVDGTTSRKYGGTGLGLTISQEIAQLLGGEIKVESELGEGSTFTFFLPIYNEGRIYTDRKVKDEAATTIEVEGCEKLEQSIEVDHLLKDKKVLIVDDDMRNIFALTTALEKQNMNVFFAENGKSALSVLKGNLDIDIILMDIMMPEMNGYDTIRSIREMEDVYSTPIIAMTAKAMKNDKEKCLEVGASDYISKPIFLDQLFSLMKVWLYK